GADARIEALTRQIADIINSAGPEQRQDLREYAVGLIRDDTEVIEMAGAPAGKETGTDTKPLGSALLLGGLSIPIGLLFFPIGLTMFVLAVVMGVFGVVGTLLRR